MYKDMHQDPTYIIEADPVTKVHKLQRYIAQVLMEIY